MVIDQTGDHEGEETDHHPVGLLAPEFRRDRIFTHISCAIDCNHAENRERNHDRDEQPVLAQ